ncbi:CDP-alcohol phosphatidyltransferase family protein [Aeromicrobium senzhongii]|uniref:CDP-alcohol phosphatidyltransferase family protein n=1 Tax=Aeromicrobium senzhongii TaxID=2663859 RepID=A0ABX6T0J9_9ACTN|nr:CDP-alcohol phosphatidyltransferase family protein [Aeromicrobium senzhongii]MTB87994.1 CDP-alcohol phosphatidyltransferase [Aeromicrobium senzhongii]QNL94995.1 CDP-alcohol phosphatidyltransferase family protein [Aeromicrobium senzhongii]
MDFRSGLEALRSAQKPSRGTAAYSRHVNRPAGRYMAAWMNSHGFTPNQATAVSATLSAAGIALIALVSPTWWLGILVAALLAGGYVMDSVDGQLARLRGGGSKSGEWLDHTVDCFKTLTLHLAVLISWYRFFDLPSDAWLLVPLAFTVVAAATYFGLILMPTLRPAAAPTWAAPPVESPLRRFLLLPIDYGFLCWVFVLLGWPTAFRLVWTLLLIAAAAMLAVALRKWWHELRAVDGLT